MGVELLGTSYSLTDKGVGETEKEKPTLTYTEIFYQCLPHYLLMGMSADEFWNCDPRLYKVYREKDRMEMERKNEVLWLQGMYVYQAILLTAPRLNSIKPEQPEDYPQKPFDLGLYTKEAEALTDEEIRKTPEFARVVEWAMAVNKQRQGKKNG